MAKVKSDVIISVNNLHRTYDGREVVAVISFEVKKGEIFGILGPNGAGKTTTMETIEALRDIQHGEVILNGINVAKDPAQIKKIIGVQLQSSAFFDKLKLKELIAMFAAIYGRKVDHQKILDDVQLGEKANSDFNSLSGGQKQRFSIAIALVNDPLILFLDEPTTGLDPQARINLWELIENIRQSGVTVVMTTHYMEEAQKLCDRVAIMDSGKIIATGTPSQLIKNLLEKGFKKAQEVEQADLEDVFIDLTGKKLRD